MISLETEQVISLNVNGQKKRVYVRNADTLLDTLREKLGLLSVKAGCENGDCGSCTVLVDGMPFNACHTLTVEVADKQITTLEGLTDTDIQEAFMDEWAIQCGYCTPGYIMNCYALIENVPHADDATIDEWLESNICRCTGYQEIKQAVKKTLARKNNHA